MSRSRLIGTDYEQREQNREDGSTQQVIRDHISGQSQGQSETQKIGPTVLKKVKSSV